MKLCYIESHYNDYMSRDSSPQFTAYFTSLPLTGERCQWGDDWDNVPYEHNAGTPYERMPLEEISFQCDAAEDCAQFLNYPNSPFSVKMINAGAVAWILFGNDTYISAGISPTDFRAILKKHNGVITKPYQYE